MPAPAPKHRIFVNTMGPIPMLNGSFRTASPQQVPIHIYIEVQSSEQYPFRVTLEPSHAVNPPAFQYFNGAQRFPLAHGGIRDNRLDDIHKWAVELLNRNKPRLLKRAHMANFHSFLEACLQEVDSFRNRQPKKA